MQSARADGRCLGETGGGRYSKGSGVAADDAYWQWFSRRFDANWGMVWLGRWLLIGTEFRLAY